MKMKKMLAVLAALSVLGSMGMTAMAEDEAVVTTTATSTETEVAETVATTTEEKVTTTAVTTAATTVETTTAETTSEEGIGETEDTEETAAVTEENAVAGDVDTSENSDITTVLHTKTYTMSGHELTVVMHHIDDNEEGNAYLTIYVDGAISNLQNIMVIGYCGDEASTTYRANMDNFFAVTGENQITITNHVSEPAVENVYDYSNGEFYKAQIGNDDPADPTFTVDISTDYVTAVCGMTGEVITESNYKTSMVASASKITSCTNGTASFKTNNNFISGFTVEGAKEGSIKITGTTGTYSDYDDDSVNTSHGQCGGDTFTIEGTIDANGNFTPAGTNPVTPVDPDPKTYTIDIPYSVFTVTDAKTGEVITKAGANKSMVNAAVTECTNGTVSSINEGCEVEGSFDKFLQSITLTGVEPGKITISGTCQSYTYLDDEHENAGYICIPFSDEFSGLLFTVTGTVDENGNFTVDGDNETPTPNPPGGGNGNGNNGGGSTVKVASSGSSSSTASNSSTPQTGDTTTLPAVALGLTMTTAGVVAVIYKKRK
jgi:LPXTG-motif cell wall-anchored protein